MVDDHLTRRSVIGALGSAGIVGLAGCTGGGDDDGEPTDTEMPDDGGETTPTPTPTMSGPSGTVKIGVLQPLSGDLKYYGQSSLWAFFSGLAHLAGTDPIPEAATGTESVTIDDVTYELVLRDTGLAADEAQTLGTDLVQNEGVDLLFGTTSSASAARVATTVTKPASIPTIIGPAASAGITADSETCSDLLFRASENTAMDARSGGKYVAQNTDVSKVYLFGADYNFGHAVVNNYRTVLEAEGIEILDEKFVPRGYSEWEGLLDNAKEAGADGIVAGFTVATLPQMFTTYLNGDYDFRVFGGWATTITNGILGQTLQKVLGKPLTKEKLGNTKLGPFTTRYHWNQYDNDVNNQFVQTHVDTYGTVPDLFAGGMFTSASAIHQAVQEGGSTEGADIGEALRGMTVSVTPKGEGAYTFQEYNGQARSPMTIAEPIPTTDEWSDAWEAAIMPGEPVATIGKDQTTIPADSDEMNCSL